MKRRDFLRAALILPAAPAIVHAENIMRIVVPPSITSADIRRAIALIEGHGARGPFYAILHDDVVKDLERQGLAVEPAGGPGTVDPFDEVTYLVSGPNAESLLSRTPGPDSICPTIYMRSG